MRAPVLQTTCDLCGYGGPYTEPEDFQRFGDVDLCYWCADPGEKSRLRCGRHDVTVADGTWTCSCGERYRRPIFVPARVLDAVPNLLNATASAHVQSR